MNNQKNRFTVLKGNKYTDNTMLAKELLDRICAEEYIQYPSKARTNTRTYNGYLEALQIIPTLSNGKIVYADNIHEYLFTHQISIAWNGDSLGWTSFSKQEVKLLMKLLDKCDGLLIDPSENEWTLSYNIYIPGKPNDN